MKNKQDVKKQFGSNAKSYVHSDIHRKGGDLIALVEMAKINGEEAVLDVATGGGHTANAFAPLVRTVTAMDLTPEMLTAAETFIKGNGHSNVKFIKADAEKMPFPDESFDIVTCRIAPHHFPNIKEFISEVYRVLKPEGQFLLDDNVAPEDAELDQFYNSIEKMRDYSHFRAWKKSEWINMIELSQFEIQELYRFEKKFVFDKWCNMMRLSDSKQEFLIDYMLKASEKAKQKFRIVVENDKQIKSFNGEAVLLKAIKR